MPQRRKPNHIKLLEGRHVEDTGVKALPGAPPRPESASPEVLALWDVMVPQLERIGIVSAVDGPSLEVALGHAVLAQKALEVLLRDGAVVLDRDGTPRKNPAAQVFRDNSEAYRQWARQLGLTPDARSTMDIPDTSDWDDDSDLD